MGFVESAQDDLKAIGSKWAGSRNFNPSPRKDITLKFSGFTGREGRCQFHNEGATFPTKKEKASAIAEDTAEPSHVELLGSQICRQ